MYRKMQVFAEIAEETREKIIEHRAHQIEERTGKSPFPNGLPTSQTKKKSGVMDEVTWDVERQEKANEAERTRDLSDDLGIIKEDSGFANHNPNSSQQLQERPSARPGKEEIARATKGTWDKIRENAFGKSEQTNRNDQSQNGAGGMGMGDERSREQREFDEMLEKERQGVAIEEKWA